MNGKSWTATGVWNKINKGYDTDWFIKEYDMKDVKELKFQLGRFYKHNRDTCVQEVFDAMEANKDSKENKSKRKKANAVANSIANSMSGANAMNNVNANSLKTTAFIPVANGNMTVPYNLSNHSMTSGIKIDLTKNNLQSPEPIPTEQNNTVSDIMQVKTVNDLPENSELQQLKNQLNSNEEYISELQCKLDETNLKYNEERKWFIDIVDHIKSLLAELNDAKKLLPEKTASMQMLVEKITETEQLLVLAKAESVSLRDKISDLTAKKVYFGANTTEINFDYIGANYSIEEEKIISKITYFLTNSDISGLIGEFSIDQIRKLANISIIVDMIKEETNNVALELYFDESNDFTELVGLVTSSKVKTI